MSVSDKILCEEAQKKRMIGIFFGNLSKSVPFYGSEKNEFHSFDKNYSRLKMLSQPALAQTVVADGNSKTIEKVVFEDCQIRIRQITEDLR
jgi:hypothetical protein